LSDRVVLLWKVRWLHETWTLSRALRRQDDVSCRVFEVCRRAIVGVPGYVPWKTAQVILGRSTWSLRRLAERGELGRYHQGAFALQNLMGRQRARLRTSLLPPPDAAPWWAYTPLLIERAFVPTWMAWHDWGRLALPGLSAWRRRFLDPTPVPGKAVLRRLSLSPVEITRAWKAPPAAVRVIQSESGYFASTLFDGSDLARLEWNRWILADDLKETAHCDGALVREARAPPEVRAGI
jgi:hypothetical protein